MQDLPARASGVDFHTDAQSSSATPLRIDASVDGVQCTLRLDGELDMVTAAHLRRALNLACEGGRHLVVVDLGGLEFVSLAGLQVLAEAQLTLQAIGCRLLLTHPNALTVRVLAITGLGEILHLRSETEHQMTEVAPDARPGLVR